MSKGFALQLIVPIFFLAFLLISTNQFTNKEQTRLEEKCLEITVDYAVEAATDEMLNTGDLGMDYTKWGSIKVDPSLAVETFVNTFCMNYDMPLTEDNKNQVKNMYIKLLTVCTFDGYYVYQSQAADTDFGYDLISTPKMPYSYKLGNKTYSLTLGLDKAWCYSNKISYTDSPLDKKNTLAAINARLSDDLMYRLSSAYENGWTNKLYIPGDITTMKASNPIKGPTVLVFVDDVNMVTGKKVSAFGIGGAKVTQARAVASYRRNGENYYCYADLLPEEMFSATNNDGTKTYIIEMFMTCEEAALAGYHHDSLYMN